MTLARMAPRGAGAGGAPRPLVQAVGWLAAASLLGMLPTTARAEPTAAPAAPVPSPPGPEVVPAAAAPSPEPPAAPAPPTPAPAAPVPAVAAAPAPAPQPQRLVLSPGEAIIHVAVSHRDAWLETRSYVDGGAFERTCRAPCDLRLSIEGREARVVAPGMTTSNVFRFEAGAGVAGVRVDGGSASARRAGVITLSVGIPVALAGMAMFALGRVHDEPGLEAGGIAGLALGGVSVAVSLPLLLIGTTSVKNAKGSLIALGAPSKSTL